MVPVWHLWNKPSYRFSLLQFPPFLTPSSPAPVQHQYRPALFWFSPREAGRVGCHLAWPTTGPVLCGCRSAWALSLQRQLVGLIYNSLFKHKVLAVSSLVTDGSACYRHLVPRQVGCLYCLATAGQCCQIVALDFATPHLRSGVIDDIVDVFGSTLHFVIVL